MTTTARRPAPSAASPARDTIEQLSDAELVARVRAGDTALFELIMRRYNRRLFRIARGVLGEDVEAEDAVQDAYIGAYRKLHQFRGPDGFATWLCRIAMNEALMRQRGRRRVQPVAPAALEEHMDSRITADDRSAIDPEAVLHAQQMRGLLERLIDVLPEPYRVAFVMREVEQMSVADTAACLGIEEATVKTRVHRARRLLQKDATGELSAALAGVYAFDGARCDRLVERVFAAIAQM
jgi:RNA polymerase sigma-70 factor (ECF subfamily)